MRRNITCIECPEGCDMTVDVENCKVIKVSGNKCPKGIDYAEAEVENPLRILTSSVLTEGLSAKMLPVRTEGPIPKGVLTKAVKRIKRIKLDKPVKVGDIIEENFMGTGINLIATRELDKA